MARHLHNEKNRLTEIAFGQLFPDTRRYMPMACPSMWRMYICRVPCPMSHRELARRLVSGLCAVRTALSWQPASLRDVSPDTAPLWRCWCPLVNLFVIRQQDSGRWLPPPDETVSRATGSAGGRRARSVAAAPHTRDGTWLWTQRRTASAHPRPTEIQVSHSSRTRHHSHTAPCGGLLRRCRPSS